ncbi:hypothetical protein JYB87_02680 [Shewanella avicenniae]|uniref:Lipoprotein n=1 Tax=Shewanella avicenniae TaxID=2814294 RepID=A0ABX7QRV9_9GAMM|nr:hypothetical protein [Shewanella avicenniae]QSX34171.1 hypothetical protein JYB87_02680 [Shewanella avicenniae]
MPCCHSVCAVGAQIHSFMGNFYVLKPIGVGVGGYMVLGKVLVAVSPLVLAMALTGCGNQVQSKFSAVDICRASMATALQQDINTIDVVDKSGKLVYVSYTNRDDWSRDIYRCKLEGNHVLWAPNKGEWQNQNAGQISFAANFNELTITENRKEGELSNHYKLSELRGS